MKIINTGGNHTPSKKKKAQKKRRMVLIGVLALVVILAGGIGVYYLWKTNQKDATVVGSSDTPKPEPIESASDVDKEIKATGDNKEKAKLYLDLSSAKQREGDTQAGLDALLKSIELNPTHQAYAGAGALYAQLGNKEKAIAMYKEALERTEKVEDPNQVSFYNDYRMEITALGGEV